MYVSKPFKENVTVNKLLLVGFDLETSELSVECSPPYQVRNVVVGKSLNIL